MDYVTVDGTAVAGRDYEPKSGTLVFGRRDLTKTIWVPVEFDAAYEGHRDDDAAAVQCRWRSGQSGCRDRLHLRLLDQPIGIADLLLPKRQKGQQHGCAGGIVARPATESPGSWES